MSEKYMRRKMKVEESRTFINTGDTFFGITERRPELAEKGRDMLSVKGYKNKLYLIHKITDGH
ncbi:MAG: hypothetical protein ACLSH1_00420 [Clostridia bacterium]